MRRVKTYKQLGYLEVTYISDVYYGEYMDTEVRINNHLICCIAGNSINEFHKELEEIISKYII